MKCPNCGFENAPGAKFCISCATPLPAAAATPAAPPQPPPSTEPTAPAPPPPPTAPATPPVPPASPPPVTPVTPAPGGPPPTPPRGSRAALFGLAAFAAIAVVGALLWFFVLKPDSKADCATQQAGVGCRSPQGVGTPTTPAPTTAAPSPTVTGPSPTVSPPSPSPTPLPTTTPTDDPPPPPPNDGRLGFVVAPCSRVTPANECKGYTFRRNAGEREFSIRVVVYNEQPNKQLVVGLVDVRTGTALLNETRWTTDGGELDVYVVNITSRGMPSGLDAEIVVRYAGKRIRFEPAAIIRWR